jgi:hypothetical protein
MSNPDQASEGLEERESYSPRFRWELNEGKLTSEQKHIAREEMWESNPGKCYGCPIPIRREELHLAVDIHHLVDRGNPGRNFLPQMRLAHHNCNARIGRPAEPTASHIQGKEREERRLADALIGEHGPPTLMINREKEPEFVKWIFANVGREPNGLTYHDAVYEGARKIDISPETAERYLLKQCAGPDSDIIIGKGNRRTRAVIFRKNKPTERFQTEVGEDG